MCSIRGFSFDSIVLVKVLGVELLVVSIVSLEMRSVLY